MNLNSIEYAIYDRPIRQELTSFHKLVGYGFIERKKTIDVVCSVWTCPAYDANIADGKTKPRYKLGLIGRKINVFIHPSPVPIRKIRLDLDRYPTIFTCLSQSMHLSKSVCVLSLGLEGDDIVDMIAMATMAQEIDKIKATY